MSELDSLLRKIKKTGRKVPNEKWLDDELFAIKFQNKVGLFKELAKTGRKYTNPYNSSVAYLLNITDEIPTGPAAIVRAARNEPPDIDMDFEDIRREEVKLYVLQKYKNVASISAFSKFTSKNLVRDISRVFAIPMAEVNRACKQFDALEDFLELPEVGWFRSKYPEVPRFARQFEGRWRASSVHPAGVVIANRDLTRVLPLESRAVGTRTGTRLRVTSYDYHDVEDIGLIKMDILGVKQLTIVSDCIRMIKERTGEEVDLESLDLSDTAVYSAFSKGHTVGVFQAEAASYKTLIRKMGAEQFHDLVVSNALVRPGPLLTVGTSYIARKKGHEPTEAVHPSIAKIVAETYNHFIFQEQLMQALVEVGKFTWSEADSVRKIIGKKRDSEEFTQYEEKWNTNAAKLLGVSKARKLWSDFIQFAGYAFNRSHSCAYSLLSYQTMWLKLHYPVEYIYSLLKNENDGNKITTYLIEAQRLGIEIKFPDINFSDKEFSLQGNTIRSGLTSIKGVGIAAAEEIIAKRPFISLEEMNAKIEKRKCNSRVMTLLEKVGALSSLEGFISEYNPDEFVYELLGLPKELIAGTPLDLPIVPLGNYDPANIQIIRGIVKTTKTYPQYNRVELEDASGMSAFYTNSEIDEGKVIIAVAQKTALFDFTYEADLINRLDNKYDLLPFEKFLFNQLPDEKEKILYQVGVGKLGDSKALIVPLHVRRFKTKKGDWMAMMIVTDGENMQRLVLFPKQFDQVAAWLMPYLPVVVKTEPVEDGWKVTGLKLASRLIDEKGL